MSSKIKIIWLHFTLGRTRCLASQYLIWLLTTGPTVASFAHQSPPDSPYQLSWQTDASLLGIGALTSLSSLVLEKRAIPLTLDQINALDRNNINSLDRSAVHKFNN